MFLVNPFKSASLGRILFTVYRRMSSVKDTPGQMDRLHSSSMSAAFGCHRSTKHPSCRQAAQAYASASPYGPPRATAG